MVGTIGPTGQVGTVGGVGQTALMKKVSKALTGVQPDEKDSETSGAAEVHGIGEPEQAKGTGMKTPDTLAPKGTQPKTPPGGQIVGQPPGTQTPGQLDQKTMTALKQLPVVAKKNLAKIFGVQVEMDMGFGLRKVRGKKMFESAYAREMWILEHRPFIKKMEMIKLPEKMSAYRLEWLEDVGNHTLQKTKTFDTKEEADAFLAKIEKKPSFHALIKYHHPIAGDE